MRNAVNKRSLWPLYAGALTAVSAIIISWLFPLPFDTVNNKFYDWKSTLIPAPSISPDIVHVDVDDKATQAYGQWPWDRALSAKMVDRLKEFGAKAVVFDIMYAYQGRSRKGNELFFKSLQESGNVISATGVSISHEDTKQPYFHKDAKDRADALFDTAWDVTIPSSIRLPIAKALKKSYVPLTPVITNSVAVGHVKADQDPDGVHRRIPLFVKFANKLIPGLCLAAVNVTFGLNNDDFRLLESGTLEISFPDRIIRIPIDSHGRMLIRWADPWKSFRHYTAADILRDSPDPSRIERYAGKIVFVGVSGTGATDFGVTPVSVYSPLSRVHSFALNTILTENFIRAVQPFPAVICFALISALACSWCACILRLRWAAIPSLILIACAAPVSLLLFKHASLEVPVARFLFVLGPAAAVALVLRGIAKEREASRTAKALQRYLSPEILRTIIDSDEEIDLKTKRKELTILVADIEHFTAISETVAPEYLSQYLNEYFEVVTQAVYENNGTVDKFLGDGILAFFGDPSPLEDHAMAAVSAAEMMLKNMTTLNEKWAGSGIPQLNEGPNMRVSINTGLVVVGNIGSSRRMEYTAFGAAVNIANQLKYKAPSGGVLLSARTRALVKDRIECSGPESIRIKGTDHDIQVYKIAKVT